MITTEAGIGRSVYRTKEDRFCQQFTSVIFIHVYKMGQNAKDSHLSDMDFQLSLSLCLGCSWSSFARKFGKDIAKVKDDQE